MTTTEINNSRFAELRTIAGLGTEGAYEVRSTSDLFGHYDIIGRTDDIRLAVQAAKMLNDNHSVACELITANEAIG